MLRLWETSNGEKQIWRASLESPGTGQRRGFANLQSLVDYLQAQIEGLGEEDSEPDAWVEDDEAARF